MSTQSVTDRSHRHPVPTAQTPGTIGAAALVSATCAALVTGLADSVGEHDGVSRIDPRIASDVLRVRSPALTVLARVFTFAGSEVVVGAVAVLLLVGLVLRRDLPRAAVLALAMGGSAFLTVVLKLVVARPRPGAVDRLGAVDSTFSFPSGHSLNSAVLLAVVVWLLWPAVAGRARVVLVAGAAATSIAVAASRVYLGYHWTTDVAASELVAAAWLSVVWLLASPLASAVTRLSQRAALTQG